MRSRKQIDRMLGIDIRSGISDKIKHRVESKVWILASTPIVEQLCYQLLIKMKDNMDWMS